MNKPRYKTWISTPITSKLGSILHAGELHNTPGIDPFNMRILGDYALILILSGTAYYKDADGVENELEPGEAIIVFPELAHAYWPIQGDDWSHTYAIFNGPQFELLRQASVLDPGQSIWQLDSIAYWNQRLEECLTSVPQRSPTQSLKIVGQFNQLLIEMMTRDSEAKIDGSVSRIDMATSMLSGPVDGVWITPEEVARRVGLNYESFRKRFASARGVAPAKFQNQKRIEFAQSAIYQGTHTFQELADELGFCDPFHFSKTFKRLTGESPIEFRQKATGGKRRA